MRRWCWRRGAFPPHRGVLAIPRASTTPYQGSGDRGRSELRIPMLSLSDFPTDMIPLTKSWWPSAMDANQAIEVLQKDLKNNREKGHTTISIDALDKHLEQLKRRAMENSCSPDTELQDAEHSHQWNIEMVRSGWEAGTNALKTCFLVSGGSAAALLAFAGSAWSALKPEGIEALALTMALLGWAVFATGIATAITYLAQYFFGERLAWHERAGDVCQWLAVVLVVGAYVLILLAYLQAGRMFSMFNIVRAIPIS